MIRPIDAYPGKVATPTAEYPDGKAQNITSPGDGTGTPWEAKLVNDVFGFQQFITAKAGITPSGTPDNATASQQFDALWKLFNIRSVTHNITTDANYTLTADQNLYAKLIITDTGVKLTASRNIVVDNVGRFIVFVNSTAQTLTVKVAGGLNVAVSAGTDAVLVSDGTDITLFQAAGGGKVLQVVPASVSVLSGTTSIPRDGTVPLISEGTEFLSQAITPGATSSKVEISGAFQIDGNVADSFKTISVFRDSVCIGAYGKGTGVSISGDIVSVELLDSPNTTSAVTYSMRIGTSAGTWYVGQLGSGGFGGVEANGAITLKEIGV